MGAYESDLAPVVSIAPSQLTWPAAPGATDYEVYQSTEPYVTPSGSPVWAGPDLSYPLPDGTTNYYFIVCAVSGSVPSESSNRVGKFTFAVVPGH